MQAGATVIQMTLEQARTLRAIVTDDIAHASERIDELNDELAYWTSRMHRDVSAARELAGKIDRELRSRH